MGRSNKKAMLASLYELGERMPSLLDIDHPCPQKQIANARRLVEVQEIHHARKPSTELGLVLKTDVAQWNVLQFNTGSITPFIIKCGANPNSEPVIKADAKVQEPKGGEIVRVVPRPSGTTLVSHHVSFAAVAVDNSGNFMQASIILSTK